MFAKQTPNVLNPIPDQCLKGMEKRSALARDIPRKKGGGGVLLVNAFFQKLPVRVEQGISKQTLDVPLFSRT